MNARPLEIFCGTGGVGKTTLAASRALHLAKMKKKVLLITLDPSRRLKDLLGLSEYELGPPLKSQLFREVDTLEVMLFSAPLAFEHIAGPTFASQRLVKILTHPYHGMNELLGLLEILKIYKFKNYDHVVVDTPPGQHFIDFLKGAKKIQNFFNFPIPVNLFTQSWKKIFNFGLNQVLKVLEKVTGPEFVEEFLKTLGELFLIKDKFLKVKELEEIFKNAGLTNWFFVTSTEQNRLKEEFNFKESTRDYIHNFPYLLINKCNESNWKGCPHYPELKMRMLQKESEMMEYAQIHSLKPMKFPEIVEKLPHLHVTKLCDYWD